LRPPFRHPSTFGVITLRTRKSSGTLTYEQKGGNQSTVDRDGVSLDAYIHALYGLVLQRRAKNILMIGCGGGTLGTMLARTGRAVTIVDIDKVSFQLAKRYFGLPPEVTCHVGDGVAFMRGTRRRFDVLVVDAFIGEAMPDHMKGASFFKAVRRCVGQNGLVLMNVCLERKKDRAADAIAAGFAAHGWNAGGLKVRLLDSPGAERNAIVLAGEVKGLRRPKMLTPPQTGAGRAARNLKAMEFRPWLKPSRA
jgi:spermidine synthase